MRRKWLVLVMLAALLLLFNVYRWSNTPLHLPAAETDVQLSPGSGLSAIADALQGAGVLHKDADVWRFRLLAHLLHKAAHLQAGYYTFHPDDTPLVVLNKISRGLVTLRQVRLIEGWNFAQVRQTLNASRWLTHATRDMSDAQIARQLGMNGDSPEGWIFPDTYDVQPGSTDLDLLKRASELMQQHLTAAWQTRATGLPYHHPVDALIMASIIEKETAVPNERPRIAEVFINRLNKGMRLQTDPTVIYGMGAQFDGNLRKQDLLTDTPWNTYTRSGLPPTPIAMPGMASIQAALHPATGDSLYFVSRGNGTHVFSSNLAQHNQAVDRFQKHIPMQQAKHRQEG